MDIDTMPAGREMDSLIAEKIFGWKNLAWKEAKRYADKLGDWYSPRGWYGNGPNGESYFTKHYSTDMGDAWEVVEKLCQMCSDFSLTEGYNAAFLADDWVVSTAETMPLAICRTALKAIMGGGNGI